jgi:geranylgeranyl diphosphate synthase type II
VTGGADVEAANLLYRFGVHLGIAFQLHDDVLDAYGDPLKFGKQVGGDIIANKKTFLLLTALERAEGPLRDELNHWLSVVHFDPAEKVNAVKHIFQQLDVRKAAEQQLEAYFTSALVALGDVPVDDEKKEPLMQLAQGLMVRES